MKLNTEQLQKYLLKVNSNLEIHKKDWRVGQTYFNVLDMDYPKLANLIRGTSIDPFYVEKNLPAFLKYIDGSKEIGTKVSYMEIGFEELDEAMVNALNEFFGLTKTKFHSGHIEASCHHEWNNYSKYNYSFERMGDSNSDKQRKEKAITKINAFIKEMEAHELEDVPFWQMILDYDTQPFICEIMIELGYVTEGLNYIIDVSW